MQYTLKTAAWTLLNIHIYIYTNTKWRLINNLIALFPFLKHRGLLILQMPPTTISTMASWKLVDKNQNFFPYPLPQTISHVPGWPKASNITFLLALSHWNANEKHSCILIFSRHSFTSQFNLWNSTRQWVIQVILLSLLGRDKKPPWTVILYLPIKGRTKTPNALLCLQLLIMA